MNDYRSKRRHRQEERDYTKSSISRAILAHCNTPEGRAEMAEWREKAAKKTEAPKPKVDPALEYYQMAFKPGSLMVTSGRRGGGKTHAALSFGQMLVSGKYPELGRWRIATNVIFLRKEGNRFVTDYPKGVHHIISMKELFPIAADVLEVQDFDDTTSKKPSKTIGYLVSDLSSAGFTDMIDKQNSQIRINKKDIL